ncbi:MAG: hypothetical protein ACOWWR_19890 [Eubacteriales bacterium]
MTKYHLYVVLVRTNTVLSNLIHIIKNDTYTHAAIALDKDFKNMYSFGRKKVYNPFIGCFVKESIDDGLYKIYDSSPCRVLEFEVSKEQYKKASEIVNHFIVHNDRYKYNYRGLLYSLLNKETINDRYLCSEFVYHVLKESGVIDLNIPKNLVRPMNFLTTKNRTVFEGKVGHFLHTTRVNEGIMPDAM